MNRECLQIFREIAVMKKDSDLYLKILSRILEYKGRYDNMGRSDIEPSEMTEVSALLSDGNEKEEDFKDLRLRQLTFRYFRTFPANWKPYGVLFERDGEPCSTFLVGRNSTGKSTIFDAIEYYYAHRISNAELKAIPKDREHEYLTYGFGKIKSPQEIATGDVRLGVRTTDGKGNYRLNELKPVCLPSMFCSDYDIFRIGLLEEKGLEDFVLEQLGYSDLLAIQHRLDNIAGEVTKTINDLRPLEKEESEEQVQLEPQDVERVIHVFMDYYDKDRNRAITLCERYVKKHDKAAVLIKEEITAPQFGQKKIKKAQRLFIEEWQALQINVSWTDFPSLDSDILVRAEKLGLMYDLLYKALLCDKPADAFLLFVDRQREAQEWVKKLVLPTQVEREESIEKDEALLSVLRPVMANMEIVRHKIINSFVSEYGSFIEGCLGYFSKDKETFKLGSDIKVAINVAEKEGDFEATPAWYLNSFRFKLYAIALKLSLAFWYMKKNKRILPVAIDDVFNANDFENSIHLQQFVHSIYEVYHDKVCQSIPLQVIMLTHDEIILSAFKKGYNVTEIKEWGASEEVRRKARQKYELYRNNCIVGRLYPHEEVQFIPSIQKNIAAGIYNLYKDLSHGC